MIELRPWSDGDFHLLERTVGEPAMMEHLGGVESPARIVERHARYLKMGAPQDGAMFAILYDLIAVGSIGFWQNQWQGEEIYETGWMVLPDFAGRGIATQAARAIIRLVRKYRKYRSLHAFPSISNVASNVVCERAGFTNNGECTFEFPRGNFMQCNDWVLDLTRVGR